MTTLKNEIIGTWRLLSYIEVPLSGSDSKFPLGKSPKGYLLFTPDGYMSVQIMHNYDKKEQMALLNYEDIHIENHRYIAFAGQYTVDNDIANVVYHIETSLNPKWVKKKQVRKLDFEGNVLYQKTVEPILSNGEKVHAYLTWQRVLKDSIDSFLEEEIINFE